MRENADDGAGNIALLALYILGVLLVVLGDRNTFISLFLAVLLKFITCYRHSFHQ